MGNNRTAAARDKIKLDLKNQVDYDALEAQQAGITQGPVGSPDNPSTKVFTVANVITFARLLLTLGFLYLFVTGGDRLVALCMYATAAVTDFLDGQVARRTQTVSWVGKIMDPIMDRVLLFTGVLGLVLTRELPVWMAALVIGRDLYLLIGARTVMHYRRRPVDVVYIGKVTTALLMAGFCDLLLGWPTIDGFALIQVSWLPLLNNQAAPAGMLLVYAGLVCSVITAVIYTKTGYAIRKIALEHQAKGQLEQKQPVAQTPQSAQENAPEEV